MLVIYNFIQKGVPISLDLPVKIYTFLIGTMFFLTVSRANSTSMESFFLIFFGSLLFAVSDSVLAIEKFVMPGKFVLRVVTLVTYFSG